MAIDVLESVLPQVKLRLLQKFGNKIDSIILFGSFARGDQGTASDLDMLIIFQSEVPLGGVSGRKNEQVVNIVKALNFCIGFSCVAGDWKPQRTSRLCTENDNRPLVEKSGALSFLIKTPLLFLEK